MIKKSLAILSISAAFFAQAQDVSVIRNASDVYSNSGLTGSAKYNAMAGAMGALGGEASVLNISSNPAGIGVAITGDISATLSISNSTNTSTLNNKAISYRINDSNLGQVGGIAVFEAGGNTPWKFINLGVSYSTKSVEDYTETAGNNKVYFNLPNNERLNYAGHAYNRTGDISKMSIALGANYDHRIYVGTSINFHGANITQYDTARMTFLGNGRTEFFNKQYTPYSEDATGFSASVGIIGKVNKTFRLGAALETPTWWSMERLYVEYGNQDAEYAETRRFSSPMKATLSAAYVPSKNLAINIDYTIGITKPKFDDMEPNAQAEMNNFLKKHKGTSEIKAGAEYRIESFRLRGGYGFANSPYRNAISLASRDNEGQLNLNSSFSNLYVGERHTLGFGIGYDFRSFYLDATYNNISSTYNIPFLQGNAMAGTEYFGNSALFDNDGALISKVKNKQNHFTFTLGWKF